MTKHQILPLTLIAICNCVMYFCAMLGMAGLFGADVRPYGPTPAKRETLEEWKVRKGVKYPPEPYWKTYAPTPPIPYDGPHR